MSLLDSTTASIDAFDLCRPYSYRGRGVRVRLTDDRVNYEIQSYEWDRIERKTRIHWECIAYKIKNGDTFIQIPSTLRGLCTQNCYRLKQLKGVDSLNRVNIDYYLNGKLWDGSPIKIN